MDLTTLTCRTKCSISSTRIITCQTTSRLRNSTLLGSMILLHIKLMVVPVLTQQQIKVVAYWMELQLALLDKT